YPQTGETALFVANSDGSNEQKLLSRQRPHRLAGGTTTGPVWAPEGDTIACLVAGPENGVDRHHIILLDVNTKSEKDVTPHRWAVIQQAAWTPHNVGLVLTGQEQQGGPTQLWYVDVAGGEVSRITNDLNNYGGVSLSADGSTLATV